ncbi:hypothetical protein AC579_6019 [Pseudocercospora musae]|uniref:Uncharacterized protein n=1 Tax=Pseudocercospora musae TaxID=113226 RepID=A0A139HRY2_9PEZI|nr:hypothetical protein AC579_6019 [Pseudocercospora musae]
MPILTASGGTRSIELDDQASQISRAEQSSGHATLQNCAALADLSRVFGRQQVLVWASTLRICIVRYHQLVQRIHDYIAKSNVRAQYGNYDTASC